MGATVNLTPCAGNIADIAALLTRDDEEWHLPEIHSSWAYHRGILAYYFTDEYGDSGCAFYCGKCAEQRLRNIAIDRAADGSPCYCRLESFVTSEPDLYCDDCYDDLSN